MPPFTEIRIAPTSSCKVAARIVIDEEMEVAHALRNGNQAEAFIAQRCPGRDTGERIGRHRALNAFGETEPSLGGCEQTYCRLAE